MKEPMNSTRWNGDSAPEKPARVQMRQVRDDEDERRTST